MREGRVADPNDQSESSVGIRKLLEHLKDDRDVEATTIATVGEKSYDGFLYAVVQWWAGIVGEGEQCGEEVKKCVG